MTRCIRVQIYLHPHEFSEVRRAADKADVAVASFVRDAALKAANVRTTIDQPVARRSGPMCEHPSCLRVAMVDQRYCVAHAADAVEKIP